ncbi:extracellular solute-binding protein [Mesorhizobium sp. M0938]|uniref:extracellular solute-binding protein n=1 Tax=unclassified Mesorhizobium TaxID=325217 RepID=UPI00333DF65B
MKKATLFGSISGAALLAASTVTGQAQGIDWKSQLGDHNGKTVRVMTITDPFIDSMKKTTDGFTKLTGAKVEIDGYGYDALHEKELIVCSQNDSSYDVLLIDGIWIGEFVEAGCIDSAEEQISGGDPKVFAWDDFTPSAAGQASWDGQRMCVPVGIYYELMYYRTDLFEQAGIEVPKTFEDLKKAAQTFTNNPKFPGVYGYAMNNKRGAAAGQQWFEWIYSAGGKPWASNDIGSAEPYADQTPLFNSKESVDLVQFFKDMVAYGPPGVESFAWDERANAFAAGKLAMINDWSVRAQIANDPSQSQIAGKFKAALMPHKDGGKTVSPVGGWIACVNAHGAQKDAAWDYLKWFGSPEVHKDFVLAGGPPSRLSAMADKDVQAKYPWTEVLLEAQKDSWVEVRPRHPLAFQLIDTVGADVNKAIIGEVTPQAAMDNANSQVTNLLKQNGLLK